MQPALDVRVEVARALEEHVRDPEAHQADDEVEHDAEDGALALRVRLGDMDVLWQGAVGAEVRLARSR